MSSTVRARVLLVEDDEGDVFILEQAVRECRAAIQLEVARDGEEALCRLRERPLLPDLVLLDLNLPKLDGREVLRAIREDPRLRRLPVIVLTSSDDATDVSACFDLHANCYLRKPAGISEFTSLVAAIETLWLRRGPAP